jgi:hypothetical protein
MEEACVVCCTLQQAAKQEVLLHSFGLLSHMPAELHCCACLTVYIWCFKLHRSAFLASSQQTTHCVLHFAGSAVVDCAVMSMSLT